MTQLKIGIVGLGEQALLEHIPAALNSKNVRLQAVCDTKEDKTIAVAKKLGVRGYTNVEDMANAEQLDFAIVSAPHSAHLEIVRALAERSIHVLKEKPLARSFEEAKSLDNIAEQAGIEVMVAVKKRFDPTYRQFMTRVRKIKNPFFIEARRSLFNQNPQEGWRGNREEVGGGCIIDLGYHLIDQLIWYFGVPELVACEFSSKARPNEKYEAEDTAAILFSYGEGNPYGTIFLSRYAPPNTEFMKVIGSETSLEIFNKTISLFKSDGRIIEKLTTKTPKLYAATRQLDYFSRVILGKEINFSNIAYHTQHLQFIEQCYNSKTKKNSASSQLLNTLTSR